MHMLRLTPGTTGSELEADIRARIADSKQPVLLVLPEGPVPALQRPEDFRTLTRLKRELDIPILFVIPANDKLRSWAQQHRLHAFASQEELEHALSRGQLRATTSVIRRTAGGFVTRHLPASQAADSAGVPAHSFDSTRSTDSALPVAAPAPQGKQRFVVQGYVEGESLEDYLERLDAPMEEQAVLAIAAQLLGQLEDLEQQSTPVVHGDISPANIVIDARSSRVHLIGFADPVSEDGQQEKAHVPGSSALGYASPERVQGEADTRADLYSLAATMHRMLSGSDPGTYPPHIYPPVQVLNPQVSVETDRLLARALTYDPALRYQHAFDMKRDVEALLVAAHRGAAQESQGAAPLPLNAVALETRAGPAFPEGGKTFAPAHFTARRAWRWRGALGSPFRSRGAWVAMVALSLLLVIGGLAAQGISERRVPPAPPSQGLGIGVTRAPDGEYIGLSDGNFAFDTEVDRVDRQLKVQASQDFRAGDIGRAETLWHTAAQEDTSDPEPLIYLEDQRVLDTGRPYITLVVGTMDSGTYVGLGRDDLQGAYIAQQEYNYGFKLPGGVLVRLLIASTGNQSEYAFPVARQIVQAASRDKTIVGVMGWPYSSRTIDVVKTLTDAHIPIVSQMASSVLLSGISPYFFRTVPPDTAQAYAGAEYVERTLHAHAVALFLDPSEAYSASIGEAFRAKFLADGNSIVATETYTVGKPETIPAALQDALAHNPDIIYFAGMAADASTLLVDLPVSGPFANLLVMGGDGLYEVHSYAQAARVNFNRLRFTAFAYPDEWAAQGLGQQEPAFFGEYAGAFDPFHQHASASYGFSRPNGDAILSYDAVVVLLEASKLVFQRTPGRITPSDLRQALSMITGPRAIQGASGQIAFGPDGNAINKAVVVLTVSPQGYIQMVGIHGQFLKAP